MTLKTNTDRLPAVRVEIYRDDNKKYNWRLISKAKIHAQSTQSYVSKQGCLIALERARLQMQAADLIEV